MKTRDRGRIASTRLYRLRQDCLADWLEAGGDPYTFNLAWPSIQRQLMPQGASGPAIAAPRALAVIKQNR